MFLSFGFLAFWSLDCYLVLIYFLSFNKACYWIPISLSRRLSCYRITSPLGSSGFIRLPSPTMDPVDQLLYLRQGCLSIEEYVHQFCELSYKVPLYDEVLFIDNKGPSWIWVVISMTHPRAHHFGPPLLSNVSQSYASLMPRQPLCRCLVTPSEPRGLTCDLQHLEEAQILTAFDPACVHHCLAPLEHFRELCYSHKILSTWGQQLVIQRYLVHLSNVTTFK